MNETLSLKGETFLLQELSLTFFKCLKLNIKQYYVFFLQGQQVLQATGKSRAGLSEP